MKHTVYHIPTNRSDVSLRAAVAADLHGDAGREALRLLDAMRPDVILIPGDLSDGFYRSPSEMDKKTLRGYRNGLEFLRAASGIAPVYYALGNHEMGGVHSGRPWAQKHFPSYTPLDREVRECIRETGATLLDDAFVLFGGVAIGGLTSGLTYKGQIPNLDFLDRFSRLDAYKLLLCHHPEYYPRYVRETDIDLTVAGHAHGGQWSFFGKAIFAPGQGLFPRLVKGIYDDRLVVSRGVTNSTLVPRIGVPTEVLELRIGNRLFWT